jgi:hypothetical protein
MAEPRRGDEDGTRRRRRRVRSGDDRGLALLMTAGGMVALLVVAALVVDIGYAKQMRREAQASADSAALAAAQVMAGGGTARAAATAARDLADSNLDVLDVSDWPGCTDPGRPDNYAVPAGTSDVTGQCVSFDTAANLVRVMLPTVDSPSFFGRVVDRDRYAVTATASAVWEPGSSGAGSCGVCAIDGGEFQQAGNANVKIDGERRIEADNLRINSNGNANRPTTLAWYAGNHSNNDKYTYTKLSQPVPNPFAAVTVDYAGVKMSSVMNATCDDLRPDEMYPQMVTIQGSCTLNQSGNYYFRNGIQANGTLKTAAGVKVTLVFGCSTGTEATDTPRKCNGSLTGNVNMDSSGGFQLGEPYEDGISLLWDETARGESVINFNGNVKLGGAFYARWSSPAFGNGTFEGTAIVYGKGTGTQNGGNIKIIDPPGGGGGSVGGDVGLWR